MGLFDSSKPCVFCNKNIGFKGIKCEFVYREKNLTRYVCDNCWKYYYEISGKKDTIKRIEGAIRQNLEISNTTNNIDSSGRLFWVCSLCSTRFFDRSDYITHHYFHN